MSAGERTEIFDTELGKLGSLICFDSIYEQLTIDTVRDGAEILLVSSNDSWFRDSAAVYQHQVQSQLRAIESGRYVVRAANTGISSIIAPDGTVKQILDPLVDGYIVDEIVAVSEPTLYMKIGNLFVYLCILFTALVGVVGMLFRRRGLPDFVGRPRAGVKIKE